MDRAGEIGMSAWSAMGATTFTFVGKDNADLSLSRMSWSRSTKTTILQLPSGSTVFDQIRRSHVFIGCQTRSWMGGVDLSGMMPEEMLLRCVSLGGERVVGKP
jgi:hypothetical protein